MIKRTQGAFRSTTGLGDVHYRCWFSGRKACGAVQVIHGLSDHGERYADFAQALNQTGFDVWAMDLPGHGQSGDEKLPGFFGKEHGRQNLLRDLHRMTELMRDTYPRQLPIFILGQGMGSFLARDYCRRNSKVLAGAIFCGSGTRNPAAPATTALARLIVAVRGEQYAAPLLQNTAFGTFNQRFEQRTPADWLNSDQDKVDEYLADAHCAFSPSAQGMLDYFALQKAVCRQRWITSMPYQFPMLFLSGADDPMSDFGRGTEQTASRLRKAGCNRVKCRTFPGMRHEILQESERHLVYDTITEWLLGVCEG
ncbi:MAG: lysophospholipase [Oscillospiraceae bacterium]|nr:lysophospholipase [Oscillospiraceae bacterium]